MALGDLCQLLNKISSELRSSFGFASPLRHPELDPVLMANGTRMISRRRRSQSRRPVSILLSDIQPHLSAWKRLASRSASATLGYLPYPVDATRAPEKMTKQRHFRTFCLAFHHFDEEGAIRVLEDAMRTADGIGYVYSPRRIPSFSPLVLNP